MLRLVTSASGFSFQHTIPTDGLLKKIKDPAGLGLTGSLAALSAKAAIWVTNFLALYLTVLDVSRYCQSKRSLIVGNLWSLRVDLILFSRVAGVARTTAYQIQGEVLRPPYRVSAKFDRWVLALLAVITFAVSTPNVVSLRMSSRQPSTSPMTSHAALALSRAVL